MQRRKPPLMSLGNKKKKKRAHLYCGDLFHDDMVIFMLIENKTGKRLLQLSSSSFIALAIPTI